MLGASLILLTALSVTSARPLKYRATGDTGSCSTPEISFAAGLDGRKETAFVPANLSSFNHGSADNIAVISNFICSQLASACGADATAQSTCTTASAAAQAATAPTGAQADAFNAAFGLTTNFASVAVINDQGQTIDAGTSGSTSAAASSSTSVVASALTSAVTTTTSAAAAASTIASEDCASAVTVTAMVTETATATADDSAICAATVTQMVTVTAAVDASTSTSAVDTSSATATNIATAATASTTASASSIGDFGSCTVPEIKFAVGLDNRKETAYEPVNLTSYAHTSADNIDIITQFMCDALVNTCGADDLAKQTCASATTAADTATKGTGAQADAFNAVFGITTDFAAVPVVNDQGVTLGVDGSSTAAATSTSAATAAAATSTAAAATSTAAAATATSAVTSTAAAGTAATASSTASASSIGNFGSCTVPQIQFGVGFDNRKETSYEPVDQTSYDHGSADNIDIITQFMCDTLTNTCGADATAKATCASAQAAADTATKGTGAQADAFNAVFGITTDFAAVPVVSDTGVTEGVDGSSTAAATSTATA